MVTDEKFEKKYTANFVHHFVLKLRKLRKVTPTANQSFLENNILFFSYLSQYEAIHKVPSSFFFLILAHFAMNGAVFNGYPWLRLLC